MPNWCECEVEVRGKAQDILQFKSEQVRKGTKEDDDSDTEGKDIIDFNLILPMPKELQGTKAPSDTSNEELKAKYGYDNWYDWCIANWGTKWNACRPYITYEDKKIFISFDTAWSPPIPVIMAWSKRYPLLRFQIKYYEGGEGYSGRLVVKAEEVRENYENNHYRGGRGG